MIWKLEDAKNRFSELVRRARADGPQYVTKHGQDSVVVVSVDEYEALTTTRESLLTFLVDSPFGQAVREGSLDVDRREEYSREVDL